MRLVISSEGLEFRYNMSRTVNVYQDGIEVDVFSLDYGRDVPLSGEEFREECADYIGGLAE